MKALVKLGYLELATFCYQYAVVLKAGLPYLEAIALISEEVEAPLLPIAKDISFRVSQGEGLAEALSAQDIFPVYMIEMIRIAEVSGRLPETFDNLSVYYQKQNQMHRDVKNALMYPAILLGLMTGVILLIVLKILPVFTDIVESAGGLIEGTEKTVLSLSVGFQWAVLGIIGLLGVGCAILFFVLGRRQSSPLKDKWMLGLPIIGRFTKLSAIIKFARGMRMLLNSGMDLHQAFEMLIPMTDNETIRADYQIIQEALEAGESLSDASEKTNLFPNLYRKMMRLGERTGTLDDVFLQISEIYELEMSNRLKRTINALEPGLVISLSIIVGIIMLLVLMPLIDIMSSIG
ncbi:type II secretion system F family protein [Fusibacter tunisiensis]|uniref:Type IV pilus assembly protein PilC n=1 Tax=Fusibacter tunisiensis TaxID=1008308 RepID=A0ABS2MQC4_9FIRM|nr:type II secretion system F family protein [Fusibacter tunisiensis]MBM7561596.1 type IV pilus assembly protein PilC [Fusibacter tunisiensis]